MGAKTFIGTPEMQRIFVFKDKLNCTMKKCIVSMATVNTIFEHGYVQTKLTIDAVLEHGGVPKQLGLKLVYLWIFNDFFFFHF